MVALLASKPHRVTLIGINRFETFNPLPKRQSLKMILMHYPGTENAKSNVTPVSETAPNVIGRKVKWDKTNFERKQ